MLGKGQMSVRLSFQHLGAHDMDLKRVMGGRLVATLALTLAASASTLAAGKETPYKEMLNVGGWQDTRWRMGEGFVYEIYRKRGIQPVEPGKVRCDEGQRSRMAMDWNTPTRRFRATFCFAQSIGLTSVRLLLLQDGGALDDLRFDLRDTYGLPWLPLTESGREPGTWLEAWSIGFGSEKTAVMLRHTPGKTTEIVYSWGDTIFLREDKGL